MTDVQPAISRLNMIRWVVGIGVALSVAGGTFWSTNGCRADGSRRYDVIHPTPENVVPAGQLSAIISRRHQTSERRAVAVLRALRGAREQRRIGRTGAAHEPDVFTGVKDAALTRDGRLVVADDRVNEIRVFDSSGAVLAVLAGLAPGRDRFRLLEAIEIAADHLLVGDRHPDRSRRLTVWATETPALALIRSIPVTFLPESFCRSRGRLYVRGWTPNGSTIHEYDDGGMLTRSFGASYVSDVELVREQLSDGRITCVSQGPTAVVEVLESWPYVVGYASSGERRWTSLLKDFVIQRIKSGLSNRGTASVLREATRAYDVIQNILPIVGTAFIVVQTLRYEPGRNGYRESPTTYLIDADTGGGWFVSDTLPRMHSARGDTLVASVDTPHPAVVLYAVQGVQHALAAK